MHIADAFADQPEITTSSDGCEIAYWAGGNPNGPSIIFLHGFALDHSVWSEQFADRSLADQFRLVAVDLRGHGRSGRPSLASAYNNGALWADDLKAVITACELENPVVVAWSFAGRMVNDYLQYFGSSTLAGVNYIAAATLAYREAVGPGHVILGDLCLEGDDAELVARRYVDGLLPHAPGTPLFDNLTYVVSQMTPAERGRLRGRALEYEEVLASLELPVLISHGADDQMLLPCLAERLHEVISDSRTSIYPGVGHAPFMENPSRFNLELKQFVIEANLVRAAAFHN